MPRANIYKATLGFPAENRVEKEGSTEVTEYSKKLSGANKDPEARAGFFTTFLSRLRSTVLQCAN